MPQQAHFDPQAVTSPIDPALLCNQDYLLAAMLPIFARGMTQYAGQMVEPKAWLKRGMRHVFDWWCSSGVGCGEPDMIDAAADIAWMIAQHVYNEQDTLQLAFDEITPYMLTKIENCKGRVTVGFQPTSP